VKIAAVSIIIAVASFICGWISHARLGSPQHRGIQWQFSAAASRGDVAELERLHRAGARIDDIPCEANCAISGWPALQSAADAAWPDAVKWLLDHGADPNRGVSDTYPLGAAEYLARRASECADILRSHGARHRNQPQPPSP
jgi:hypothetical protein